MGRSLTGCRSFRSPWGIFWHRTWGVPGSSAAAGRQSSVPYVGRHAGVEGMERERALELLCGGTNSVARWNRWRTRNRGPFDLTHSDLSGLDLTSADLSSVDLHASNLSRATLVGANLEGADLHRSNLKSANLCRAILRGADLHAANLTKASLFGADLRKSNLKRATLRHAEADSETKWPQGFEPAAHGIDPWPAA
ncbi:MAG: pentapeptide repeat-containing protein [Myxococcota bacterium]|nr:pentapeptide repeat-containing protein [Myxococcota bacterium]